MLGQVKLRKDSVAPGPGGPAAAGSSGAAARSPPQGPGRASADMLAGVLNVKLKPSGFQRESMKNPTAKYLSADGPQAAT